MNRNAYFQMDEWTFDQSENGWRGYPGSNKQKIDLILDYIDKVKPKELRQIMMWHAGQLAAMRRDKKMALKLMSQCICADDKDWNDYVLLTLSFIADDKQEFQNILVKVSEKNPNYETIKILSDNFGKEYDLKLLSSIN